MKAFDLRPVMALLNNFTASIRELVLEVFQQVRHKRITASCPLLRLETDFCKSLVH